MRRAAGWSVVLFFAGLLALGLAIHRDYGISWDEPLQRFTGAVTVKHLAERFAPSLVRGEAVRLPALGDYVDRDHGTAFEAPAVALEALLGLSDKRDIFMFRHLLTFLVCFLGVIALWRLATRRFADWRLGLVAALLLVLSPRLFAESFYNSKDAVFMAAFAIALNTAVAFVLNPGVRTALLYALATGFAIDIRVMAVILPVASIAVLILRLARGELPVRRTLVAGAVYLPAAFVAAVAMWVWLWSDPIGHFLEAFASMAKFRYPGDTLYMGANVLGTELPWHYIPVWISITTPPLYLALFVVGAAAILWRLASRGPSLWQGEEELQDLFFLGLVVVPVLAVIALQSVLYGGWRHLYFIYPAFLLVAVRGWLWLWDAASASRLARGALALVTALSLVHTAILMGRAHPLQNVYFNVLAGGNLKARYDLDYWGLANRMALEYILRHDPSATIVVRADSEMPLQTTVDMLTPAERQRLKVADDGEPARYVLNNYHGFKEPDLSRYQGGYDLFYEIIIDGEVILSVFKRRA
jgi:Dolichyl-phosphate-mannose-protein mannosyltransferase